jgi:hypothetical protein
MQSGKEKATQLNFLERYGLKFLRRWNRRQSWAVRHLSLEEAGDIKRTERRAIVWAGLAGIVSGTILGTTEMSLWGRIIGELEISLWGDPEERSDPAAEPPTPLASDPGREEAGQDDRIRVRPRSKAAAGSKGGTQPRILPPIPQRPETFSRKTTKSFPPSAFSGWARQGFPTMSGRPFPVRYWGRWGADARNVRRR